VSRLKVRSRERRVFMRRISSGVFAALDEADDGEGI
jgi:hypothetical protein